MQRRYKAIKCVDCGKIVHPTGPRVVRCKECNIIKARENNRVNARNYRQRHKDKKISKKEQLWGKEIKVTEKQMEFVFSLRGYRRKLDKSQAEMAHFLSLYGKQSNIKFSTSEIFKYENFQIRPGRKKFHLLCQILNIDPTID